MRKVVVISLSMLLSAILVCFLTWVGINGFSSFQWFRDPQTIRSSLLIEVPIGSSFESVKRFISSTDYEVREISKEKGHYTSNHESIGDALIRVWMGGYQSIFSHTDITAFFVFDEKGELIEIDVRKDIDCL